VLPSLVSLMPPVSLFDALATHLILTLSLHDALPISKPSTNPRVADARARGSGIDSYMERTSNHLSAVTKMTGLLLAPPLKRTTIARVELVPLEEHRALAVLVTDSGWVTARPLTLEPPLPA